MATQPQPDYWQMTNKELVIICKQLGIHRWSGKRKKDLIAMIKATLPPSELLEPIHEEPQEPQEPQELRAPHTTPVSTTPNPPQPLPPPSPEPYEFLDETLLEHANRARAFLPKSPTNEYEEPIQECNAAQTTPATEAPMVRLPVGMAAISFADMDNIRFIEY